MAYSDAFILCTGLENIKSLEEWEEREVGVEHLQKKTRATLTSYTNTDIFIRTLDM